MCQISKKIFVLFAENKKIQFFKKMNNHRIAKKIAQTLQLNSVQIVILAVQLRQIAFLRLEKSPENMYNIDNQNETMSVGTTAQIA